MHVGISWVTLASALIAVAACCLVVGGVGLLVGEPVQRATALLFLGAAALITGVLWLLLRKAPG